MRIYVTTVFVILLNAIVFNGLSQCNSINVVSPVSVCKNESFELANNTSASSYSWDFCPGDLVKTPSPSLLGKIGIAPAFDLSIVEDQGKWYAFTISIASNTIRRIDLGTNLMSVTPVETDLGNPGNLLGSPTSLKVVKQGNNWFCLVFNQSGSSITLLNFGTSILNSTPTASVAVSGIGGVEGALDVMQLGTTSYVVLVSNGSGVVSSVTFPNGLDQPTGSITSTSVGGYLVDIQIVNNCNSYSAIVLRYDTRNLIRLDYGNDFTATPTITSLPANQVSFSPYRLWIGKEGNNIYGMISNIGGGIANVDFGTDITNTNPTITEFGNFATAVSNSYNIFAVKQNENWVGFTINGNNSNLYALYFPNLACDANVKSSNSQNPGLISYSTSGVKTFIARVVYADGTIENKTIPITIQNTAAPSFFIDSVLSKCLNTSINFTINTSSTIQSATWDFGDGFSSGSLTPTHQYAATGNFQVNLKIIDNAGCSNTTKKKVSIFNPPASTFNLPTNSPLCTNQIFTFPNTSTFDAGSNPTWEWFVNGSSVSTAKDLQQSFGTATAQTVKLKASIQGCFNESSQVINSLLAGPQVAFNMTGKCEKNIITFTNTTTDPVASFAWDFGDGQTSTSINDTHIFATAGTYNVVLQGNGSNGCQNSSKKSLTIYSNPAPDFSLSLPPFSCSGTPSQFNDLTPGPLDSNLAMWGWDFDDAASGQNTSTVRNAKHTYVSAGIYNVSLTVTTNFGCSSSIVKAITVSQSPVIGFKNGPACYNKGTHFTDTSASTQSWQWQIENATYSISDPIHVFAAPGDYVVNLTTTSTNNCIGFLSKTVSVLNELEPDFSFQKNCTNQNTEFVDLTNSVSDPVVSQQWTFGSLGQKIGSPAVFNFNSTGSIPTTLEVTAQSGCKYSISKNVDILSGPTVSFMASPDSGVPPLNVQFTNNSTNATSYLWAFNDSNSTTSTLQSPSFTFVDKGDHIVDLTAYNNLGCSSTISKLISAISPFFDVSLIGFNIVKNEDGSLKLIASLKNEGNISLSDLTLALNISGITTIREKVETIAPRVAANHVFSYEITDASRINYLCATVVLEDDPSPEGNEKCVTLDKPFFLYEPYPSPVTDNLNVDWISSSTDALSITIIDAVGQQLIAITQPSDVGLNSKSVSLTTLSDGLYICVIKYGNTKEIKRIAVKH